MLNDLIKNDMAHVMEMNIHPLNKYSTSQGDYPYYSIIPHKFWRNKNSGKEVSIYGTVPYISSTDEKEWEIVTNGFTIRNNKTGYVGFYIGRFDTIEAAAKWIKSFFDKKQEYNPSLNKIDITDKKISIKMIKGYHLTATEKKGFEILFREYFTKGIKSGRVGRTDYFLEETEDNTIFSCVAIKMEKQWIGADPTPLKNKFLLKVIVK